MASYGTFITACGFEYHGPHRYIRFAPKISPENFKAPFVTAQGWGTYTQQTDGTNMKSVLEMKYGSLLIKLLSFEVDEKATSAIVTLASRQLPVQFSRMDKQVNIELMEEVTITASQKLAIQFS
jgi:hypothetical protein